MRIGAVTPRQRQEIEEEDEEEDEFMGRVNRNDWVLDFERHSKKTIRMFVGG